MRHQATVLAVLAIALGMGMLLALTRRRGPRLEGRE